jgi:hypothetical protein
LKPEEIEKLLHPNASKLMNVNSGSKKSLDLSVKIKEQVLSQRLKQAANDLSRYNQAIAQKRSEKDGLTLTKETVKTNKCS